MIHRRILCALLAAGGASFCLAFAENDLNSGQWLIDYQTDNQVQLTLHRDHQEHAFPVAVESFHGLTRSATHFEFVRDAGSFLCDGRFAGDHGAGTFVFTPNPKYVADMKSLGYTIEPDRMLDLAAFDVSRAFVHDLEGMGYHGLSLEDLVRFRIHGVTITYVRDFQNAGYKSLSAEDLVRFRIHGAAPEFAQQLAELGYGVVAADSLVQMRIHGVSIEFLRDLKAEGYSNIPVDELIRMKIHGVTPEMVKKVQTAGFAHPTTEQLVEMRIHGLVD